MKKYLFLFSLLFLIKLVFSQDVQVPNGGFENWTNVTYFENPDNFITTNDSYNYVGKATVFKSTDKYHGLYAIKVQTVAVGVDTVIGYAKLGSKNSNGIERLGVPFTEKPTAFHCFIKYNTVNDDAVFISVNFKNGSQYIENKFYYSGNQSTSYKELTLPLKGFTFNPDTLEIAISSSSLAKKKSAKGPKVGNWLIVDYMNFTGATTPIPNADFETWIPRVNSDPVSWATLNNYFIVQDSLPYASLTNAAHTFKAIKIQARELLVGNIFRTMCYVTTGKYDQDVFDIDGLPIIKGGFRINSKPDSARFWYKYDNNANPDDSAIFILDLKNGINSVRVIKKLEASAVYKYVTIPIPSNLSFVPDTANIILSSVDLTNPAFLGGGNILYADDISFYYGGSNFKVSGTVTYDNTPNTLLTNNVKIYLINTETKKKDSTFTDAAGKYQFNNVAPGTYTLDGTSLKVYLNSGPSQGLLAMKASIGLYTIKNALRKRAGDVSLDTKVNSTDALLMSKRFVGIIKVYKIPFWLFENPSVTVGTTDMTVDFKGICAGDIGGAYIPPAN